MREVVGRTVREVDAGGFAHRRGPYARLLLDVGTGDGKHVLASARKRPATFVVGMDASPDGMRRSAQRAAQKVGRGGLPNAMFVWASAEQPPAGLTGVDDVHVLMPWGSLLRAIVAPDVDTLAGLARMCADGARFLVTLNLHAWRPRVPEVGGTDEPTPETVDADGLAGAGWQVEQAYYPSADELAGLGTSWTKRLASTRDELAVLALRGTIVS